jgi:hypothetical protein
MPDTATTARVKIGLISVTREIDVEVEDADAFIADFEETMRGDDRVWWITEPDGRRRGLILDKVAYVDVEPQRSRTVGFG